MDYDDEDFNPKNLLGHVYTAKNIMRRCIDVVAATRIRTGRLEGRTLDDHLENLLEIERELSARKGSC
jgi:hypothetical protein